MTTREAVILQDGAMNTLRARQFMECRFLLRQAVQRPGRDNARHCRRQPFSCLLVHRHFRLDYFQQLPLSQAHYYGRSTASGLSRM